jgi:GNAT superfamily N-acetyltransferase
MIIRKCNIEDMPAIISLVVELAVFEKEPHAVVATLDEYEEAFKSGLIDAFVADDDGVVVGMALYYSTFSTWKGRMLYLEDFVVNQHYRSAGIGQQLFDAFVNEGKIQNCRLVKWQVLDWNESAIRFYQKNKAELDTTWYNGIIRFVK